MNKYGKVFTGFWVLAVVSTVVPEFGINSVDWTTQTNSGKPI